MAREQGEQKQTGLSLRDLNPEEGECVLFIPGQPHQVAKVLYKCWFSEDGTEKLDKWTLAVPTRAGTPRTGDFWGLGKSYDSDIPRFSNVISQADAERLVLRLPQG